MNKLGILEGILFVVGDEGINLANLCEIMSIEENEAKELLLELKKSYEDDNRGIRISYLGDSFKLTTKEEHKEYYQKSDIWYMVKHILEKTGISEVSIEELQEYKEKQLQSIRKVNPEIEKTKTMVYPSAYSEEQVA